MTRYAWRITWHRTSWSGYAKSRIFERRTDADAFLTRLTADNRPDLSPLDRLEFHRRPVGGWEPLELPGGAR
jgi:hypothetical protein